MLSRARKNLRGKPGIVTAQSLSLSISMNLSFRSSSQIIHRRLIHILNKKSISNYIQPFLIWIELCRDTRLPRLFCQTISFDLRKNRQLHCFHSYPYKRALGMKLTRPALKSSKVSGNRTGFSRGRLATLPSVGCSCQQSTAPSDIARFPALIFVAFCLQ